MSYSFNDNSVSSASWWGTQDNLTWPSTISTYIATAPEVRVTVEEAIALKEAAKANGSVKKVLEKLAPYIKVDIDFGDL